jgi:hypothetical protein
MANQRKAAMARAGLGAAAVMGIACLLFFGTAIEHAAESVAACMDSTHSLRDCDRPGRAEFWEPVVILGGLGFFVGVMCFIYGHSYRDRT